MCLKIDRLFLKIKTVKLFMHFSDLLSADKPIFAVFFIVHGSPMFGIKPRNKIIFNTAKEIAKMQILRIINVELLMRFEFIPPNTKSIK